MALRINEEIYLVNDPRRQVVTDVTSFITVGDQTRTMTSRITLDDGSVADFTSVRWRRGAVELFADVVNAGTENGALIRKAVESLDDAYTSQPSADLWPHGALGALNVARMGPSSSTRPVVAEARLIAAGRRVAQG